jgi:hypothetical protein
LFDNPGIRSSVFTGCAAAPTSAPAPEPAAEVKAAPRPAVETDTHVLQGSAFFEKGDFETVSAHRFFDQEQGE